MLLQQVSKTIGYLPFSEDIIALRLLDQQSVGGVLLSRMTSDIYKDMKKKHPSVKHRDGCEMNSNGAAGPSGLDAIAWTHILLSHNYCNAGKGLRWSISSISKERAIIYVDLDAQTNPSTSIEAYIFQLFTRKPCDASSGNKSFSRLSGR